MQPTFCPVERLQNAEPGPGELFVWPRRAEDRLRIADVVLKEGLDALRQGPGPIRHVLVNADPTLDDMLAALLVERRLAGQELFSGFRAFTRYAALVREGLHPGSLPVAASPEGVYFALRAEAGKTIDDAESARRFLAAWQRMASVIVEAARNGIDPEQTPLFADREFSREHVYLAGDEEVYRMDVQRGERWWVKMPGGPPQGLPLLLLFDPKSVLFKHWARQDPQAVGGHGYPVLAVDWGANDWVFTTDPRLRLSLEPLAKLLQEAEAKADPQRIGDKGWFDGKVFRHTLVAAPHGGSVLPRDRVLKTFRRWVGKQRPPRRLRWWAAGGLAVALLILAALLIFRPRTDTSEARVVGFTFNGEDRGTVRGPGTSRDPLGPTEEREVTLRPSSSEGGWNEATFELSPPADAEEPSIRFQVSLEDAADPPRSLPVKEATLAVNDRNLPVRLTESPDKVLETDSIEAALEKGSPSQVRFRFRNGSTEERRALLRFSWRNAQARGNLHVLAVGVSKYEDGSLDLPGARNDAVALSDMLVKQRGEVFGEVRVDRLVDAEAKRARIHERLAALCQLARKGGLREQDLVVLAFAGHGESDEGLFYFLPHDCHKGDNPEEKAISWPSLWSYLRKLPCRVVVLMDACHSGDIEPALGLSVVRAADSQKKYRRGVYVLAACLGYQQARDLGEHGALTLALLEGVKGAGMRSPISERCAKELAVLKGTGELTLGDLRNYASLRVLDLTASKQRVIDRTAGDITPDGIPLFRRPAR